MKFDPGFNINPNFNMMKMEYGDGVFGPVMEKRTIDAIRPSLKDPNCEGPEIVYSIAMDVGRESDRDDLFSKNLLYGTVMYASGSLGEEPIRSQGHIHAVSKSCGMSTPEVYEIWSGKAYIYMQETAKDSPGRCYAVLGEPGDVIVVPPGWAHSTISADPSEPLVFGAWCVRDFGFDYEDVRAHNGLAFFPVLHGDDIVWEKNESYTKCELIIKKPEEYKLLDIEKGVSIYKQYILNPDRFLYVVNPSIKSKVWESFIP